MLQHLDALNHFYLSAKSDNYGTNNRSSEYCIICEDDILISTHFKTHLPQIATRFHQLKLDVLLLGYLTTIPFENPHFPNIESHRFYGYPDDLWGSQMYMVSKEHARHLINTYTTKWATTHPEQPYSPDWILTKYANKRALLYPPLAIENGKTPTTHEGQRQFHKDCYEAQKHLDEFA
jgi:GR25 family glycosyltransferase involved in LPS biosynthesis